MSELRYDFKNCLAEAVGPEHGLSGEELCKFAPKVSRSLKKILREKRKGQHAFLSLPYEKITVGQILRYADSKRGKFKDLVVLGIGGSALGITALHAALSPAFHNLAPAGSKPRLFVLDNIDPEYFSSFLDRVDWENTLFIVISKSGSTAETLAQFLIVREKLVEKFGESHKEKLVIVTDPESGPLREIARSEGYASFPVPILVGGRFSVLSPVGLLPAALCGLDIVRLLAGAKEMDERCRSDVFNSNPAIQFAAVHYLMHKKKKKPLFVSFVYGERFRGLGDWQKQLVAESLGKRLDEKGAELFSGPTPVSSAGVTDQHSQVQLFIEGPFDKFFTFFYLEKRSRDLAIPAGFSRWEDCASLSGHSLGDLFDAERQGTELALTQAHRPNGSLIFSELSESSVGEYFFLLELAVAVMGKLYKINPYDQPGVEAGKKAAREFLKTQSR